MTSEVDTRAEMFEHGATVLIADDDPDIVRFVRGNLKLEGFRVHDASNGLEAVTLAREVKPDCVILDVMMPEADGYKVCRELRADPATSDCAIILLSARMMSADKIEGFASGADDYVGKPFDPSELVARVRTTVRRRQEMRERSPLTGLLGNKAIAAELDRRVTAGEPLAVVHIDLDSFKGFNDRYGFLRGDCAISLTAAVVLSATMGQPEVFIGHIGGDDFVLMCHSDVVVGLCEAIVSGFTEREPELHDPGDDLEPMTLSLGVAIADTGFESSAHAATVAARTKNDAKRRKGNCIEIRRVTARDVTAAGVTR